MNKGKAETGPPVPKIVDRSREGDLFSATSVGENAKTARDDDVRKFKLSAVPLANRCNSCKCNVFK
jgi:hypothetical protein